MELPERADRLTYMKDGLIFSKFPLASEQIKDRGVDLQSQYIFDIHLGEGRIFIPIYYEGKLVSYVGRACWWIPEIRLRYKYPSGTRVTDYLFNWDGVKQEKTLILVENTFNAIWINNNLGPCTSTFGSNLSDSQITLITSGHFASVVILWDEGADMSAYKAVKKLRAASTPATYVMIDGQPDDHSLSFLREVTETGYKKAVEGGFNWTNYRKKK
ncbi:MAG: hypothetical protein SVK08_02975 [Halobacteriota archaeon]|nr:hypothetical protein [Halobacteriota archaeon]